MPKISGSIWSIFPLLGLLIFGPASKGLGKEILAPLSMLSQAQMDHTAQWSQPLVEETITVLEQKGYTVAIEHYQQRLSNALDDQSSLFIADTLFQIGFLQDIQNRPEAALIAYRQSLQTLETLSFFEVAFRRAELSVLIGWLFRDLGDREEAKIFLEAGISIYQELQRRNISPPQRFGDALYVLGRLHDESGDLADALRAYEHAHIIFRTLGIRESQLRAAVLISGMHADLGNYGQAYQIAIDALTISQTYNLQAEEADILTLLGFIQRLQHRYEDTLDYYQQALHLKQQIDPEGTLLILNNLGYAYLQLQEIEQAKAAINLALTQVAVADSRQAKVQQINILNTLGSIHTFEQSYPLAWKHYTLSLRLSLSLEDKIGQIITWTQLAQLLHQQGQIGVAIAFYKQAINDIEQVRENLRSLPLETQKRYTETVADSYRQLAALLLDQERVFEAQQVLDLLKIQELEDYLHDVREERPQADEKLPFLPPEQILLEQHRILLLEEQSETDPVLSLEEFLNSPAVAEALENLTRSDSSQLQPESLQQLQRKLKNLPHVSGVLYPLVLHDRLELLFIPPNGAPIHKTVAIDKPQLTEQVGSLRDRLADPSSDVKALAGELHDSVVAPLQTELDRLNIENIIYVPDSVLHYIPLSVFYDRTQNQWLAEQYTSHNITASDVGDLTQPPGRPFDVLAAAFADTSQTFEKLIDQRPTSFYGLTYAGHEVSFLQEKLPKTRVLLDADFSRNNLEAQLNGQNIVHLATHAAFVPGQPEESFILLGDGDTITLKELRNWSLPNVDLVVLSACQTGISHIEDGLEILGMGFQVQRTDARAALASLWWVDDRSTSRLMELFYSELSAGATKAQALQYAQRQLIASGQDEPYYWAAFVLIGNGL